MQAMKAETLQAGSIRINTVRVDKALLVRVLDIMDGSQAEAPTELRRGARLRYRIRNAIVYPDNMDRTIAFVVPTRNLYKYLTDRVGNIDEIDPYFDLWRCVPCSEGVLEVVVVEHDAESLDVPRISKGTDGRALA